MDQDQAHEEVAELTEFALRGNDPPKVMARALDLTRRALDLPIAVILQTLPGSTDLLFRESLGLFLEEKEREILVPGTGTSFAGYTLQGGARARSDDFALERRFTISAVFAERGARSGMGALLSGLRQPAGALLAFDRRPRAYRDCEARLLRSIAQAVSASLQRQDACQMQLELQRESRLAALGTLSATVAHEINNPLTYVITHLECASERLEEPCEGATCAHAAALRTHLSRAAEGAARVRKTVRDLKAFARGDEESAVPVDLHATLEAAISLAWTEIRHRARLERSFSPCPPVHGDEARLCQVFLNLLINAAQAIPEGRSTEHTIRVATSLDGEGNAVVEFQDSGSGIRPEVLPRIFEPFFTTKPKGVGTGLGLSICREIVESFGGDVSVESRRGCTSFRVTLRPGSGPRSDSARPAPRTAETEAVNRPEGTRILIVDDEPILAQSLRQALKREHSVTVATSGGQALELIRARPSEFDLILCDVMMPDVTGMDVHAELARTLPELAARMVFMTGGAFTPRAAEFLSGVPNLRLEKPFGSQAIRETVREALGRDPRHAMLKECAHNSA